MYLYLHHNPCHAVLGLQTGSVRVTRPSRLVTRAWGCSYVPLDRCEQIVGQERPHTARQYTSSSCVWRQRTPAGYEASSGSSTDGDSHACITGLQTCRAGASVALVALSAAVDCTQRDTYRVFLCIGRSHPCVVTLDESPLHVRFQHSVNHPFHKEVCAALSPYSSKPYTAFAVLMQGQFGSVGRHKDRQNENENNPSGRDCVLSTPVTTSLVCNTEDRTMKARFNLLYRVAPAKGSGARHPPLMHVMHVIGCYN